MSQKQQLSDASAKIENSSAIFREMVQSLRAKCDRISPTHLPQDNSNITTHLQISNSKEILKNQQMSESPNCQRNNPQDGDSEISKKPFYSQRNEHAKHQIRQFVTDRHSFRLKADQEDSTLRLKPKGNIGGRDIMQKRPLHLPRHSFDRHTSRPELSPHAHRKSYGNGQQSSKEFMNHSSMLPRIEGKISESRVPAQIHSQSANFTQNKLNKLMAKSKKLNEINEKVVMEYCKMEYLDELSQAKDIFLFFNQLCKLLNYYIEFPLIKKYKNCIYFGRPIVNQEKYDGFLYYFDRKVYFGDFLNGQRSGEGVEISFQYDVIFKGVFCQGLKSGKFEVYKPNQRYAGMLDNGLYHGQGKLITKESIYQGFFDNGDKNGQGTEIFPKTGLRLSGKFYHGYFDTKNQSNNRFPQKASTTPKMFKILDDEDYDDFNWKRGFSQGLEYQQKMYESRNLHRSDELQQMAETTRSSKRKAVQGKQKRQMDIERNKFGKNSFGARDSFKKPSQQINFAQGYQEFQHSFDVNSRQDTQMSNGVNINSKNLESFDSDRPKMEFRKHLEMIEERMETNQFEDPLPVPIFLQK